MGLLFILFGVGIGVLVAVLVCKQCNRPTQGGDTPPVRCPEDNDGSAQYVCSQPSEFNVHAYDVFICKTKLPPNTC